jgi:hypothetical protein
MIVLNLEKSRFPRIWWLSEKPTVCDGNDSQAETHPHYGIGISIGWGKQIEHNNVLRNTTWRRISWINSTGLRIYFVKSILRTRWWRWFAEGFQDCRYRYIFISFRNTLGMSQSIQFNSIQGGRRSLTRISDDISCKPNHISISCWGRHKVFDMNEEE